MGTFWAFGPSSDYPFMSEVKKKELQLVQRKMSLSRVFAFHNIIRKDSVRDKQHDLKEPLGNNKPVFWTIASSADLKQLMGSI